jgi:hypothetical protein
LLLDVSKRCSESSSTGLVIKPGTVFRYIGRYKAGLGRYNDESFYDTEPVIFTSSPYLALSKAKPVPVEKSLPEFLYGYNVVGKGANVSSKCEVSLEGRAEPLTMVVPQLWSLAVGSGESIQLALVARYL